MAYMLHYEMELTQSQVPKRITVELKLDKPVSQWEMSRWIKRVENWRIRRGLPVDSVSEESKKPGPRVFNEHPC
ncbi:MAG: hypothetical protein ACFFCW_44980 [Candidatus Hodarchaeota archaeon]